jgi:Tol biopolymer transport system component
MKNFFKTSIYIFAFAFTGIMFQIACSNSENSTAIIPSNKIVFTQLNTSGQSIWICNGDGSNLTQIPITLPANFQLNLSNGMASPRLSPDGLKVYFVVNDLSGSVARGLIYSCNIDGTNLQEVVNPATDTTIDLGNII